MDKIKNVFRPGHKEDDATMYRTDDAPAANTATSTASPSSPADKKEHGVINQILSAAPLPSFSRLISSCFSLTPTCFLQKSWRRQIRSSEIRLPYCHILYRAPQDQLS